MDAAAGAPGREVTWFAEEFAGFRHGYAGTIYKGQGKTLDHTHLLHTHHWRAAASYVALTRQRESAQVFVAEDTARDAQQLARQMGRGEVRAASVAWATPDELSETQRSELRRQAGQGQSAGEAVRQAPPSPVAQPGARTGAADPARAYWGQVADRPAQMAALQPAAKVGTGQGQPDHGWLIPPYADLSGQGRDSLGRGTSPGEVASIVAADKAVQREREARWSYLQGAYREPHAARAALYELVKSQGWTSAAARVAADPLQLGELRGKEGLFAGTKARADREAAQRAAGAIEPSLERIGAAEARAERSYRVDVDAQRMVDATGSIPRLSAVAEVAIGAIAVAMDEKARAEAWLAAQADERVADELRFFGAAVEQRFGEEGVRAMLRAGGRPGAVTVSSVTPGQRPELDRVAELTVALKTGEHASTALSQREAESERQAQRHGLRR